MRNTKCVLAKLCLWCKIMQKWVQNDVSSSTSAPLFHRLIWWSRQSRRRWRLFVQHSQPGSCTWTTCSSTFLFLNCFAVHVLLWHCSATGWSKETVTSNLFLTGPKNSKSGITQWFLGSLCRAVLVFWCFKSVKCVDSCLLKLFQYRTFASPHKA